MTTNDGITFEAIFFKASTTIDGGWQVTFSVNQSEAEKLLQVSQYREEILQVAVVPNSSIKPELSEFPSL